MYSAVSTQSTWAGPSLTTSEMSGKDVNALQQLIGGFLGQPPADAAAPAAASAINSGAKAGVASEAGAAAAAAAASAAAAGASPASAHRGAESAESHEVSFLAELQAVKMAMLRTKLQASRDAFVAAGLEAGLKNVSLDKGSGKASSARRQRQQDRDAAPYSRLGVNGGKKVP
eukprot:TRINITY_DN1625_c0_g1_i1.p2 TRINITY_DN1625_c0_g1~~TRINITY_DN1625_c0_g1_i1.p2  ORF type:complete len:173 (-),score=40.66 TRINITY_DN1625_c0_g1_i1:365-883(-)